MGEDRRATCMICGREFPIYKMEQIFTGRMKYRCCECRAQGNKQMNERDATVFYKLKKSQRDKIWK